ncbi:hypothetical protein KKC45_00395 [Patescibacteria group bacterium]|nr:hypothetical protein [Patescibacteria group bacterium]
MDKSEKILFLCAKTIVLFEICRCMASKRTNRYHQIKWLACQISKKISEKEPKIFCIKDYIQANQKVKNFLYYCLGELMIKKLEKKEVLEASFLILRYRLNNLCLKDLKIYTKELIGRIIENKKFDFNRLEVSNFLNSFILKNYLYMKSPR